MLRLDCDRCGREIVGDDVDADGIRVQIAKQSANTDEEFLYVMSGDEDGDPSGKHYCSRCVALLLKGASSVVQSAPDEDEPAVEQEGDVPSEEA
jgi:hypothetical protein